MLSALQGRVGALEPFLALLLTSLNTMDEWEASRPGTEAVTRRATVSGERWLTERELVILREMPSLMTLSQIAGTHGISTNTVKTHVRSIYCKLDIGTRREAVAVARRRGIL